MSMTKRILSLLLALTLLLGNVPAVVFATEDMTESVVETETVATEEVTVPEETELPTQPETVPEETSVPTEVMIPSTEAVEETTAPTEAAEPTEVTVTDEAAMAATVVASGTFGENMGLTWVLDGNGTLTVSGTGSMYYELFTIPIWEDYKEQIKAVVIEDGVTDIIHDAFRHCVNLTSVTIADTVTKLNRDAFWGCTSLISVTIPGSVTEMEDNVFNACTNLSTVRLEEGLSCIGERMFANCTSLTSVTIPDSVTAIGDGAFSYCDNLASVSLPDSLRSIGNTAFTQCNSLRSIEIPHGVTTIGWGAFEECEKLEKVTIPSTVTSMEKLIFSNCYALKDVTLSAGLQTIGDYMFERCTSLTSITIPAGVTSIGNGAFSYCYELKNVSIPSSVTDIGQYAFNTCKAIETVELPKNLTVLSQGIFSQCFKMSSIKIPDGVTRIEDYAFSEVGKLPRVIVPGGVEYIGYHTFSNANIEELVFLGDAPEIGEDAFFNVTANAWYPENNNTWTAEVIESYGTRMTWIQGLPEWVEPEDGPCRVSALSALDYMAFSEVAYENFKKNDTVQSRMTALGKWDTVWGQDGITYGELCANIADWKVVRVGNLSLANGFYAVAFENDYNEVVIAYRGSVPPSEFKENSNEDIIYDWLVNDFQMQILNIMLTETQSQTAFEFYEMIQSACSPSQIVVTGHSLGGALAGMVSAKYRCKGVTMNSASMLDVVYEALPADMGQRFYGVDDWNFVDHVNEFDKIAGMWERYIAGDVLKPIVVHDSGGAYSIAKLFDYHSLSSFVSRDSSGKPALTREEYRFERTSVYTSIVGTNQSVSLCTTGNDTINDSILGGSQDTIYGGKGNDIIYAGAGRDVLIGGQGGDTLDGGWGDDFYIYYKGDGVDSIKDTAGDDTLYLRGFSDDDKITVYEGVDQKKYIYICCNDEVIIMIHQDGRAYSGKKSSDSFKVSILRENGTIDQNDITDLFNTSVYETKVLIGCPVSIEILDAEGNVVYTVADGEESTHYTEYGNFYVFQEEDGSYGKSLELVAGYTFRIIGEAEGTMDIEFQNIEDGVPEENGKKFENIPVTEKLIANLEVTDHDEFVLAADTDGDGTVDTKLGYDGKPVPVESLNLVQEYIVLKPEETFKLHADVKPAELSQFLRWEVEKGSENILQVEQDGSVTGRDVGTAYVLVAVNNGGVCATARCRVDVAQTESSAPDEQPVEKVVLEGIQLSTDKVTTELYKNEFATFEILLDLPQNHPVADGEMVVSNKATMGLAGMSNVIESAELATNSDLFQLVMLDDRTVQVVPTQKALDNAKTLKGSYEDTVIVKINGQPVPGTEKLTLKLTVKKTLPKLKATVAAFNSFYDGQTQPIVVTGGTAISIYENESKNTAKTTAIPNWLTLNEDETLSLKPDAPLKSVSGSAFVMVETAEWRIPVAVTLSVKNTYKLPGVKLSATTVTVSSRPDSEGIALELLCTNKNNTLSSLKVTGISAPEDYEVSDLLEDGSFTLKAKEAFEAGEIPLKVHFEDTRNPMELNLKVKTSAVTLKLASSSVKLNQAVSDHGKIKVTVTPADYRPEKLDWQLTTVENEVTVDKTASEELDIRYENGELCIYTTDKTPEKATYKLLVSAGGSKPVTVTVNVINAEPAVTLKATGSMDLSFPNQTANIAATFTNYNGAVKSYTYSVAELKGKTVVDEEVSAKFRVEQDGKTFKIRCVDDSVNLANTYAVTLKMTLENGKTLDKTINLKVKRTIVKLKISTTKLSLNKLIGDEGSVTVTCATKGYALSPNWTLTDSKNVDAAGELNIRYEGDKLYVATKDETVYGKTYRITLKADAYGTASVLTIAVPLEEKSTPTVTIKAAGKVDVIRDGSAVTITPTYKNCITTTGAEETITILNSKKEDVTDQFEIVPNGKGGYTVTKAEKGKLPAGTYKVKLVAMFGQTRVKSEEISMSVVMGSVKLTAKTSGTTMFAKDRNDYALIWFETADGTLNDVSSITFKNAAQAKKFDIVSYGDGLFAIVFKDGKVDTSLLATGKATSKVETVSLNVFVDGNVTTDPAFSTTAKANTTVSVKLTIVK